mgnify:CR=1 FL=1
MPVKLHYLMARLSKRGNVFNSVEGTEISALFVKNSQHTYRVCVCGRGESMIFENGQFSGHFIFDEKIFWGTKTFFFSAGT